jgi:hypothetical protein
MIAKIRNNYMLSNLLSKALLVCTYIFANWKIVAGTLTAMLGSASWAMILFVSTNSAAITVVLAHFLPKLYLSLAKIHSVPHSEFSLLATLAWTAYNLLVGLLNLILLAAPTFLVWGAVIFPVVSVLASGVVFYVVTSKLYFNDATRPHYFKTLAIAVLALALLGGVL